MLSQELIQTARNFESLSASGTAVTITGEHAAGMARYFRALAEQAATLEGRPVPATDRGDLPEGVVSLSDVRAERQARAFIRGVVEGPQGPGGAA